MSIITFLIIVRTYSVPALGSDLRPFCLLIGRFNGGNDGVLLYLENLPLRMETTK